MLRLSFPSTNLCLPAAARPPRHARPSRASVVVSASAATTSSRTSARSHGLNMATACSSFYEILGIPIGATNEEIKTAYRRLALVCHPDVASVGQKASADEFMRIHTAYSTLSDPQKRAVYDGKLYRRSRPLTAMTSGYSAYRGRNWETDQCW